MTPSDITSDMTRNRLIEVFQDSAGYDGDDDPVACRCLIKAGRMLLARPIRSINSASRAESVELDPLFVENMVKKAESWLACYTDQQADNVQYEPSPTWRD